MPKYSIAVSVERSREEIVYFSFFLGLRLEVWPQAFLRQLVALEYVFLLMFKESIEGYSDTRESCSTDLWKE